MSLRGITLAIVRCMHSEVFDFAAWLWDLWTLSLSLKHRQRGIAEAFFAFFRLCTVDLGQL